METLSIFNNLWVTDGTTLVLAGTLTTDATPGNASKGIFLNKGGNIYKLVIDSGGALKAEPVS